MQQLFDSHAHVAFESFDADRAEVIARAQAAGVEWLEIGTDILQSERAVQLAHELVGVWATVGVHPSDIAELDESGWQRIETLLDDEAVVAVGEVGFDYYRGGTHEEQLPALERFVDLALGRNLPVVFHVRDPVKPSPGLGHGASPVNPAKSPAATAGRGASGKEANAHDDLIDFLQKHSVRGVIHTFSGTDKQAEQYLELGMHLSFSGVVTFKNAGDVATVARTAPLDRILIETDCPFLAPEPYRGKRNEPAYVQYVAAKVAQLRGVPPAAVEAATQANARELFQLPGT